MGTISSNLQHDLPKPLPRHEGTAAFIKESGEWIVPLPEVICKSQDFPKKNRGFFVKLFIKAPILITSVLTLLTVNVAHARTLHIVVDISASNPVATSQTYANLVAEHVSQKIMTLEMGDQVSFRSFGALGFENLPQLDFRLSRKNKPQTVATGIGKFMITIPQGRREPQGSTSILAQLEWIEYDCAMEDVILMVTDGIETSSQIPDSQKLLKGEVQLPSPDTAYLTGCHVEMVGVGKTENGSWPSNMVKNLVTAWEAYMKAAGANFKPIPNP